LTQPPASVCSRFFFWVGLWSSFLVTPNGPAPQPHPSALTRSYAPHVLTKASQAFGHYPHKLKNKIKIETRLQQTCDSVDVSDGKTICPSSWRWTLRRNGFLENHRLLVWCELTPLRSLVCKRMARRAYRESVLIGSTHQQTWNMWSASRCVSLDSNAIDERSMPVSRQKKGALVYRYTLT
jgi:hypothetical protein